MYINKIGAAQVCNMLMLSLLVVLFDQEGWRCWRYKRALDVWRDGGWCWREARVFDISLCPRLLYVKCRSYSLELNPFVLAVWSEGLRYEEGVWVFWSFPLQSSEILFSWAKVSCKLNIFEVFSSESCFCFGHGYVWGMTLDLLSSVISPSSFASAYQHYHNTTRKGMKKTRGETENGGEENNVNLSLMTSFTI